MMDIPHTHKVTMTLTSNEDDGDVAIKVEWDPDLVGSDLLTLGYIPASYFFMQAYILPALEAAYLTSEFAQQMDSSPASMTRN